MARLSEQTRDALPTTGAQVLPSRSSRDGSGTRSALPLRAGVVLLAHVDKGARCLLVGEQLDAVARAIDELGATAIRCSATALGERRTPGRSARSVDSPQPAPGDGDIDAVILHLPPAARSIAAEPPDLDRLLQACFRLLRAGGTIVVVAPRDTASVSPGAANARRLRAAGFEDVRVRLPWRNEVEWSALIPVEQFAAHPALELPQHLQNRAWARIGVRALQRSGLLTRLVRTHVITAAKAAASGVAPAPILVESILRAEGVGTAVADVTVLSRGPASFTFLAGGRFFKVALDGNAVARLRGEAAMLPCVSATPLRSLLLAPVAHRSLGSAGYAVYPQARPVDPEQESRLLIDGMTEVCRVLAREARAVPLCDTDFWARLFDPGIRSRLERDLGLAAVLDHVERTLAQRSVPSGIVHNDLNRGNLMLAGDRFVVIDWDRAERLSPVFLDAVRAALTTLPYAVPKRRAREVRGRESELLFRRDVRVPLTRWIDTLSGDLSWSEMMWLFLLNSSALRFSHGVTRLPAPVARHARSRIELCHRWCAL